MILFFDTSVLVKFFSDEAGSDQVSPWILNPSNELWLFELALLEYRAALLRKLRNREITQAVFEIAEGGLRREISRFQVEPISRATMRQAEKLLETYGQTTALRTLDALHAAAFSLIAEPDWFFVTADTALAQTIEVMGYRTMNPLES